MLFSRKGWRMAATLAVWCLLFYADSRVRADLVQQPILRAGISAESFPEVSLVDIEVTIKLLAEELGKNSGYDAEVTAYTDEALLKRDFEQGKINFVVASSLTLATEYDQSLFSDGFRFMRASDFPDRLLIVGRSGFRLAELSGKRVLLAQRDPLGELYMDYFSWATFRRGYRSNFKVLPAVSRVNQLLLKIFFNDADLTCVYQNFYETALELNPQMRSRLTVYAHLDDIPAAGAFFRKDAPAEFREKVIAQARVMGDKPRGKQLMDMFRCDRILRSSSADLIPARHLFDARQRMALVR
jgi:ABC-type phosphate/phosphonate transport system substrate-binding protein